MNVTRTKIDINIVQSKIIKTAPKSFISAKSILIKAEINNIKRNMNKDFPNEFNFEDIESSLLFVFNLKMKIG